MPNWFPTVRGVVRGVLPGIVSSPIDHAMNEAILEQFCPPMVLTEPELGWRCRDIAPRVFELVQTCLEKSVYAF